MASKDDENGMAPEDKKQTQGSGQDSAAASPSADDGDLGLDLSADPEFLALAADFDASISNGVRSVEQEPESAEASDSLEEAAAEGAQIYSWPEKAATSSEVEPPEEAAGPPDAENEAEFVSDVEPDFDSGASEPEPQKKPRGAALFHRRRKDKAEPDTDGEKIKEAPAPKVPRLTVTLEAAPTLLSRVYDTLALGAVFVLAALFILQVLPSLQAGRLLWFSDELRQADVLSGVFNGHWRELLLNGQLYQEAPPLYYWFLFGLHKLLALAGFDLGTDYARLLFMGSAISGLLFLLATFALARNTARLDLRGAFASGCVLLSVLFLQFFYHYSSLDLFFAAFVIASHIFMFKALMKKHAPFWMGLAFLCAAVALMTKGALGLVLPVLSAVLFTLWRGRPQRLLKGDFLLGLVFALLPVVVWLGSIWAGGEHALVVQMFREQIWVKAFGDAWHKESWWYYLAVLPGLWLPWSFVIFTLPWHKLFSRATWDNIKSARSGERQGLAFVWIFLLGSFALISLIQHKQAVYLVPLMGPLAVLTGRAVLQLSPLRSAVLQRVMCAFFFLLAVTFVLLPVYYSGNIPGIFSWLKNISLPQWQVKINGVFLLAVIVLGTACLLIGVLKSRRPESTLLVLILSATLFSYPLSTMTMPSLDGVLSSKSASVEIKRYADLGYYPVSFKNYSGVFSYYSGLLLNETDDWAELERIVAAQHKIILAMNAKRWESWTQNPGFTEIMRFWMLSNEYVLLLRNVTPEEAPPARPENGQPLEPDAIIPDQIWEEQGEPVPAEPGVEGAAPLEEPAGGAGAPGDSAPGEASPEKPVLEEPAPVEPPLAEPEADKPAPAEPAPAQPMPGEALPAGPAPAEPAPVESLPVEPLPVEPLPAEPFIDAPGLEKPAAETVEAQPVSPLPVVPVPGGLLDEQPSVLTQPEAPEAPAVASEPVAEPPAAPEAPAAQPQTVAPAGPEAEKAQENTAPESAKPEAPAEPLIEVEGEPLELVPDALPPVDGPSLHDPFSPMRLE